MSEGDQLGLPDFPQGRQHSRTRTPSSPHSEPLIVGPSTAPAMVSGSEIPIAPSSNAGSLAMLTAAGEVRPLEEMENEIIRFAISHYRGQMSEVARRLKIGRSTLYRKLDEAAANDPAEGAQDTESRHQLRRAAVGDCGAPVAKTKGIGRSGTCEPWLAGDRQTPGGVAKPRNPNENGSFQVSLS